MSKYDVGFNTELFSHFIVEAKSEEEAITIALMYLREGVEPDDHEVGSSECTGAYIMDSEPLEKEGSNEQAERAHALRVPAPPGLG